MLSQRIGGRGHLLARRPQGNLVVVPGGGPNRIAGIPMQSKASELRLERASASQYAFTMPAVEFSRPPLRTIRCSISECYRPTAPNNPGLRSIREMSLGGAGVQLVSFINIPEHFDCSSSEKI